MFNKAVLVAVAHFACTALILKILGLVLPCCVTCYYSCAANTLLFLYVARFSYEFTKKCYLSGRVKPENRAVLITGCDSGFGNRLARRLDTVGYHVFASCLFPSDKGAFDLRKSCSKRLQILELDVTKDESVKSAVDFVKENLGTSELWAVVNNAGVFKGFHTEFSSMQDFKDCLEVNSLGPVRVTKAFLPLLKQSRGRVVNLTSLGGRLSGPHASPYIMSKFAAVAFTECLKQEMDVWGIRAISVEPEVFATNMTSPEALKKSVDETYSKMDTDIKEDYGDKYMKNFKKYLEFTAMLASKDIQSVVSAMEDAISLEYPASVYTATRNFIIKTGVYILERIPRDVLDLIGKVYLNVTGFPRPRAAGNNL